MKIIRLLAVALGCFIAPLVTVHATAVHAWKNGDPYSEIILHGNDGFDSYTKVGDSFAGAAESGSGSMPESFLRASIDGTTQIEQQENFLWTTEPQDFLLSYDVQTRILTFTLGTGAGSIEMTTPIWEGLRFNGVYIGLFINRGTFNSPPGSITADITSFNGAPFSLHLAASHPKITSEIGTAIIWWEESSEAQQSFEMGGKITTTEGYDWNRSVTFRPVEIAGATPAPEPTSSLLLALGAVALGARRNRRV